ncbi:hypothetical protein MtrunA17_Chr7g0254971 [Medicago truncatula]|uniref:Uncharacterized protein n=1 Tax=Medicago truncatula TaxID=3880 RepID=A0A396H2P5_MEDTR|nr:hypothetical protein MtrunA17_Chr7g0254971 [Medicago truncatula]
MPHTNSWYMKIATKFNKKTDTKRTDVSVMMAKASPIFTRRQTCTTNTDHLISELLHHASLYAYLSDQLHVSLS